MENTERQFLTFWRERWLRKVFRKGVIFQLSLERYEEIYQANKEKK